MTEYRTVRTLAPITLAEGEEVRLELVEFGTTRWLNLSTWHRAGEQWVKLPGSTKLPVHLLGEVRNRFTAAAA